MGLKIFPFVRFGKLFFLSFSCHEDVMPTIQQRAKPASGGTVKPALPIASLQIHECSGFIIVEYLRAENRFYHKTVLPNRIFDSVFGFVFGY
jgi:hypothetical protein